MAVYDSEKDYPDFWTLQVGSVIPCTSNLCID